MSEELKHINKTEEVKKKLNELMQLGGIEDFLKTNEFTFDFKEINYKVKKPNYKQKQETYQIRIEKYTQLLKEKNKDGVFKYSLEEDLKKDYKARGIDIDAMDKRMKLVVQEKEKLMMKLGEGLASKASKPDLDLYRKEIEKLDGENQTLIIKKTQLLEYSIENQLLLFSYSYLTYLIAEKKEGDKWIRVWNTLEEYENDDEDLLTELSFRAAFLIGAME